MPLQVPLWRQVLSTEPIKLYPASQLKRSRLLILKSSPPRRAPWGGNPGSPQIPGFMPTCACVYIRDRVNTTKQQWQYRSLKQSKPITVPDENQMEEHAQEIQIESIPLMWNKGCIQLMSISLLIGCSDFVYLAGKRLAGCLSLGLLITYWICAAMLSGGITITEKHLRHPVTEFILFHTEDLSK